MSGRPTDERIAVALEALVEMLVEMLRDQETRRRAPRPKRAEPIAPPSKRADALAADALSRIQRRRVARS